MQDKQDQSEVERLRLENGRLRQALIAAGITLEQAATERASSDAQQSTDLAISRAETSVARGDARAARFSAAAAALHHSQQVEVAASALATSQALVAALQERDRRQAALIELGERLRDLTDTASVVATGSEITARAIDATRAAYGKIDAARETVIISRDWNAPGTASIAGTYHFRDFGTYIDDLKRGETVVVDDAALDPRTSANATAFRAIGIAALINVPLIERGQLTAVAIVQHDTPHTWTVEELAFVTAVGDRMNAAMARLEAEARQSMLNGELAHRLKNTIAVVQAIAAQTLRGVTERDLVDAFDRRVLALAQAHEVLIQKSWSAARMRDVIEGVLSLQADLDRFALDGPEIDITAEAALSLSLLLHELATNALKHGALSVPAGTVSIRWYVDEGAHPHLRLDWTEAGGPPVSAAPTRKGFGSKLIHHGLIGTRAADLRYEPNGLRAEFRAPLAELQPR